MYNPYPGTTIEAGVYGEQLELKGHIADELCIEILTNIWDDAEGSSLTPRAWDDTLIASDRSRADLDKAICRSLVGDRSRAVRGAKHNELSRTWKRGGMVDWMLVDPERDQLDQSSLDKWVDMFNDMMNVCYGRRMALLTDGRLAILPAAAKKGDVFAAFHGGNSLYVVRHLSNRQAAYTFIGECYVDGLMDGAFSDTCKQKPARRLRLV